MLPKKPKQQPKPSMINDTRRWNSRSPYVLDQLQKRIGSEKMEFLPVPNRICIKGLENPVDDYTDIPKRKFLKNNWYSWRRIKRPKEINDQRKQEKAMATSMDNSCY